MWIFLLYQRYSFIQYLTCSVQYREEKIHTKNIWTLSLQFILLYILNQWDEKGCVSSGSFVRPHLLDQRVCQNVYQVFTGNVTVQRTFCKKWIVNGFFLSFLCKIIITLNDKQTLNYCKVHLRLEGCSTWSCWQFACAGKKEKYCKDSQLLHRRGVKAVHSFFSSV